MVSKASEDFPLPLGPVTTVSFPSGRSRSMPLRLFWRAPRISTHPHSGGAMTQSFSTTFESTGNYSRMRCPSQILRVIRNLLLPFLSVHIQELAHLIRRDAAEFIEIQILHPWNVTNRRFVGADALFAAIDYPVQHSHVIAETRPQKFSVRRFAEPVHVKNQWWIGKPFAGFEPVPEIIADVVAAERQHCHRIAPDLPDRAGCGRGRFRWR